MTLAPITFFDLNNFHFQFICAQSAQMKDKICVSEVKREIRIHAIEKRRVQKLFLNGGYRKCIIIFGVHLCTRYQHDA